MALQLTLIRPNDVPVPDAYHTVDHFDLYKSDPGDYFALIYVRTYLSRLVYEADRNAFIVERGPYKMEPFNVGDDSQSAGAQIYGWLLTQPDFVGATPVLE